MASSRISKPLDTPLPSHKNMSVWLCTGLFIGQAALTAASLHAYHNKTVNLEKKLRDAESLILEAKTNLNGSDGSQKLSRQTERLYKNVLEKQADMQETWTAALTHVRKRLTALEDENRRLKSIIDSEK